VTALTSLSPDPRRKAVQQACIDSWRAAGLQVVTFNHDSERERLACYGVEIVPVKSTAIQTFGRHYVPIHSMLDWAAWRNLAVLLINSDIELRLKPHEMNRLRWLSDDGLCYFIRHNWEARDRPVRELYGIDAFLLHGRNARGFPPSFLSMGQPWWDYWLPHTFVKWGLPVYAVEWSAAWHQKHDVQWSQQNWHRCGLEFDRVANELNGKRSFAACVDMSWRVRGEFDKLRKPIPKQPGSIQAWLEQTFGHNGRQRTFLELGAHDGTDTVQLAKLPGVTLHAFEPDPRNNPQAAARGALFPNVSLYRVAISDHVGVTPFTLSKAGWGKEWTHSSSIHQPKAHLQRYPVTFGETIEVPCTTLDAFCDAAGIGTVDFIWADIQGAEGEMVRGGMKTLGRTRYLYTEYSDDEMYEGQPTLSDLMRMLPGWRVVELWPDDVLLENKALCQP
jgi:FkbM family methyltransferase